MLVEIQGTEDDKWLIYEILFSFCCRIELGNKVNKIFRVGILGKGH